MDNWLKRFGGALDWPNNVSGRGTVKSPFKDYDGDGFPNMNDCQPKNPKKDIMITPELMQRYIDSGAAARTNAMAAAGFMRGDNPVVSAYTLSAEGRQKYAEIMKNYPITYNYRQLNEGPQTNMPIIKVTPQINTTRPGIYQETSAQRARQFVSTQPQRTTSSEPWPYLQKPDTILINRYTGDRTTIQDIIKTDTYRQNKTGFDNMFNYRDFNTGEKIHDGPIPILPPGGFKTYINTNTTPTITQPAKFETNPSIEKPTQSGGGFLPKDYKPFIMTPEIRAHDEKDNINYLQNPEQYRKDHPFREPPIIAYARK
jgi:hypothetical protein